MKDFFGYEQKHYDLQKYFKKIEDESLTKKTACEGQYLCFRLDGIKASKFHLKDTVINQHFNDSLNSAIFNVYQLLRYQIKKGNINFFLGVLSVSDEVSFILNNCDNYYRNRIMKIGTMLSGLLSASMTAHYQGRVETPPDYELKNLIGFDSRPLVLKNTDEIKDYLWHRYLLGHRNAIMKVLRLKSNLSDEKIYESDLKNNFKLLYSKITDSTQMDAYIRMSKSLCLYLPNGKGTLIRHDSIFSVQSLLYRFDNNLQFHFGY